MPTKRKRVDHLTLWLPFKTCKHCNSPVDQDKIECPQCGMLYFEMAHRFSRIHLTQLVSENFNGEYKLLQNPDRTLNCTCHSFLLQRGVQNGAGATCKHIRMYLDAHSAPARFVYTPAAPYQLHALRELAVENLEFLSYDQGHFLINENLSRQGIGEAEFMQILSERGRVNGLPIYQFGVEFEGAVKGEINDLLNALNQNQIPTVAPAYTHEIMNEWKIVNDASVRAEEGYQPLELVSPKLHGIEGFNLIKKALLIWNGIGGKVGVTAGTHVHIDAYDLTKEQMIELAKVWAKIEKPVLWYLVSPSRRNGMYSKRLDMQYLVDLSIKDPSQLDRRHSLNFNAFSRHKTIEFRLHNGTLNPKKIISWIIFLLKLVESVRKGITHREIEPTITSVLDAIGIKKEGSVQIVRMAREALIKRYEMFVQREKQEPQNEEPVSEELELERIEEAIIARRAETEREERLNQIRNLQRSQFRRRPVQSHNPDLPLNSLINLSSIIPTQNIRLEVIESSLTEEGTWVLPSSRNSQSRHTVRHFIEDRTELMTCTCRGFRSHTHCYHSVNIARYLALRAVAERREGEE